MSEFLILADVLEIAEEYFTVPLMIFGKKSWIKTPSGIEYDFLFHAITAKPEPESYKKFKEENLLMIPSLDFKPNDENQNIRMAEIHKHNSLLTTYALRKKTGVVYTTPIESSLYKSIFVEFYDISLVKLGREVKSISKGYTITHLGELRKNIADFKEGVEVYLNQLKQELDEKYGI